MRRRRSRMNETPCPALSLPSALPCDSGCCSSAGARFASQTLLTPIAYAAASMQTRTVMSSVYSKASCTAGGWSTELAALNPSELANSKSNATQSCGLHAKQCGREPRSAVLTEHTRQHCIARTHTCSYGRWHRRTRPRRRVHKREARAARQMCATAAWHAAPLVDCDHGEHEAQCERQVAAGAEAPCKKTTRSAACSTRRSVCHAHLKMRCTSRGSGASAGPYG